MGLGFGVAQLFHQSLLYLLGQLICKVAVRSGGGLVGGINRLDSGINVVSQSLFLFFLGNHSLIKHVLENGFAFFRIGFLTAYGVVLGRVLSNTGDNSTLRQCQIRYFFIKIPPGGNLYAQSIFSKVNGI